MNKISLNPYKNINLNINIDQNNLDFDSFGGILFKIEIDFGSFICCFVGKIENNIFVCNIPPLVDIFKDKFNNRESLPYKILMFENSVKTYDIINTGVIEIIFSISDDEDNVQSYIGEATYTKIKKMLENYNVGSITDSLILKIYERYELYKKSNDIKSTSKLINIKNQPDLKSKPEPKIIKEDKIEKENISEKLKHLKSMSKEEINTKTENMISPKKNKRIETKKKKSTNPENYSNVQEVMSSYGMKTEVVQNSILEKLGIESEDSSNKNSIKSVLEFFTSEPKISL